MLEVLKRKGLKFKLKEEPQQADIIVTKYETKTEYTDDGSKLEKRVPIKVNITKKINETKKLLKTTTAEQKTAEIEKIFSK